MLKDTYKVSEEFLLAREQMLSKFYAFTRSVSEVTGNMGASVDDLIERQQNGTLFNVPDSHIDKDKLRRLTKEVAGDNYSFYDALQNSVKTAANGGAYGALACNYFDYKSLEVAADITAEGRGATQLLDRKTDEFFTYHWHVEYNEYFRELKVRFPEILFGRDTLGRVMTEEELNTKNVQARNKAAMAFYADTDSLFIEFEKVFVSMGVNPDEKVTDSDLLCQLVECICVEVLTPMYNIELEKYATDRNLSNHQEFELENMCGCGVLQAKKKYAFALWWKDGQYVKDKKKYKMSGIELKKRSTPPFVTEVLEKFLSYMLWNRTLTDLDYFKFAAAIKKHMATLDVRQYVPSGNVKDFTSRAGIDKKGMYYVIRKHPTTRGLVRYNNLVLKNGLETTYPLFEDSGRIHLMYDQFGEPFAWPADEQYPELIAPKPNIHIMSKKYVFKPMMALLATVTNINLENLGSHAVTLGVKESVTVNEAVKEDDGFDDEDEEVLDVAESYD